MLISYSTGRDYGKPQVLEIQVLAHTTDDFEVTTFEACFVDAARGISGKVNGIAFFGEIGSAVLNYYDAGQYTH